MCVCWIFHAFLFDGMQSCRIFRMCMRIVEVFVLLTNAPLDKVTGCVVSFFKHDDDDKDDADR